MADMAASILAKLKNKAKGEGIPLQQLLNLFCQEEFIRRLSESKYKQNLILKGGFLLYSISGFTTRPTIISLMEATGRMKDFYDIYYLATNFDFDGRKLQEAIYETLSNRGTPY